MIKENRITVRLDHERSIGLKNFKNEQNVPMSVAIRTLLDIGLNVAKDKIKSSRKKESI